MNPAYSLIGAACRRVDIRGKARLARWLTRHPSSGRYRDSLGYRRSVDLSDPIEALLFVGVDFGLPGFALNYISEGDLVIDAGANIGAVAAQLCRRVGDRGSVMAFEPLHANVERLKLLGADNRLPQLRVFETALSDGDGKADLRFEEDASHTSPYGSFTASWMRGGTITVTTKALDELVPLDGKRVTFLKLDVEGAEPLVLTGAERLLADHRPAIYCEFNDIVLRDSGSSADELLARFADAGYEIAAANRYEPGSLKDAVTDLLMLPRERQRA